MPQLMGPFHFVDSDGVAQGPLALRELKALFAAKSLTESSQVICSGDAGWSALDEKPQLLEALAATTETAVVPVSGAEALEQLSEHFVSVERRFSDFVWLHKALAEQVSEEALPLLPSKGVLSSDDEKFRGERRAHLERYIKGLMWHPKLQRNDLLKAWLTTQNYAPLTSNRSAPLPLVEAINTHGAMPLFLCHALEATLLEHYIAKLETHLRDTASRMQQFTQISTQLDEQAERQDQRLKAVKDEEPPVKERTVRCEARASQEKLWLTEQQEAEQMVYFVRGDLREQQATEQQVTSSCVIGLCEGLLLWDRSIVVG